MFYQERKRDTAHHTKSRAITAFTCLEYFENINLNTDPKADRQIVKANPMKAKSMANPKSAAQFPA